MLEIKYNEQENEFSLCNGETGYYFRLEKGRWPSHRFFGRSLQRFPKSSSPYLYGRAFCPTPVMEDQNFSLNTIPREYPDFNAGDFRSPAFILRTDDNLAVNRFVYKEHFIVEGKPPLEGLPAVYTEQDDEAKTLILVLEDEHMRVQIRLYYTIFRHYNAICRHVEVVNQSSHSLDIERLMSMSMDFADTDLDLLSLSGCHLKEKNIYRRRVSGDAVTIESIRGTSSPQATPAFLLCRPDATESAGEVWGFNFVYSGDFYANIQKGQYETLRVQIGMNPSTFSWKLDPGQTFVSPETVLVYSKDGLNGMSQVYHKLFRERLCRGSWRDKERPILLNDWEAYEFDVNEEKMTSLAESAAKAGVELLVMDDGWFQGRNDDQAGLGDWIPDPKKFPCGIAPLAERVKELGLGFGIWVEPEMINMDSDLYRSHPDWIIRSPRYDPVASRFQYVLDLANPEVCAYVVESISKVIRSAPISYVKWDMNRHLTDLGSSWLPKDRQKELSHRYVLGLYRILEELTTRFPDVLFESCSSGGGRFDAGMMYYMPQVWTSDNSDAISRLDIQYGTSLFYAPIMMGAHVSAVPNGTLRRSPSLETRFAVAASGNLGYELDLQELSEEENAEVAVQIRRYQAIRNTIQFGTFYRIKRARDSSIYAWNFVSPDGSEVILFRFQVLADPAFPMIPVHLQGLDPHALYQLEDTGEIYGGDELMYAGLTSPRSRYDFDSQICIFKKLDV